MIPHMTAILSRLLTLPLYPAFEVPLLAGADCERAGRDVLADGGAGADVCALPDRDRRDQLRVAADERPVFDRRRVLVRAVVVAGDRAGADVDVGADDCITEIREMHRLGAGAENRFLEFHEVADLRPWTDHRAVAKVCEWSDRCS